MLAIAIVAISGFGALVGAFWGFGLQCDDSCGTPPPWRDDPNAWQWDAMGVVAIGGFVCSLVFVATVAARRRTLASAVFVSWGALAIAFLRLFKDSGLTSHAERGWRGLTAVVIAGLVAIALTPTRKHRLNSP